ncbi:hypothetical protein EV192_11522 [Actinocrispum wychmicini]|uniref:MucB/RseB-like sigma(E) regulatory protein n=1 Tax=Actinocrispum wychmicini TaxID=1213861 RepID=A0A4R2ITI2_9PSEU|nr:hypothetical protein EV192_11522 [Actinocrispum wychmicini]
MPRSRRWFVVAGLTAAAAAVPVVSSVWPARDTRTDAAKLRERMLRSADVAHQGYAESVGRLAVPELPKLASVTALLSGTTQMRTWYAARDRYRFAVLNTAGERDVFHEVDAEYLWDSGQNTFTEAADLMVRLPRAGDLLPPDLARRILAGAPGDAVSAIASKRVAGVSAAGLRLAPADPDTTVGYVDMWADPDSGLPLQVELTAKGASSPVIMGRFLEIDLGPPPESALSYEVGPDVGFNTAELPDVTSVLASGGLVRPPGRLAGRARRSDALAGLPGVGLYGAGLSSFVMLQLPRDLANSAVDAAVKAGAQQTEDFVRLEIPPLSLAVQRVPRNRRTYLLAGLVSATVLQQAGTELAALPRGNR